MPSAAVKKTSPAATSSRASTPSRVPAPLPRPPTDDDVRQIAESAEASTHSVWKRLAGAVVKGRVSKRIDAAIQAWRKAL